MVSPVRGPEVEFNIATETTPFRTDPNHGTKKVRTRLEIPDARILDFNRFSL